MNLDSLHKNHLLLKIALGIAAAVVIILSFFLVQQYRHIARLDYVSLQRQSFFRSLRGSGPLSAADASSTESWMTFDYIDRAFLLPPSYLQMSLPVNDSRFPRMTIAQYAKDAGLSTGDALLKVQAAISAYSPAKQ